jgi:hypothetical protein
MIWYLILAIALPHYGAISTAAYAGMIKAGSHRHCEGLAIHYRQRGYDASVCILGKPRFVSAGKRALS